MNNLNEWNPFASADERRLAKADNHMAAIAARYPENDMAGAAAEARKDPDIVWAINKRNADAAAQQAADNAQQAADNAQAQAAADRREYIHLQQVEMSARVKAGMPHKPTTSHKAGVAHQAGAQPTGHASIKQEQQELNAVGMKLKVDGREGPATRAAEARLERDLKLKGPGAKREMLRQIKGDSAKVAAIVAADPKMAETASSSTTKHTHVAAHAHGAPRHKLAMAAP